MLIGARKTLRLETATPGKKGHYQTEDQRAEVKKWDFVPRRASKKSLFYYLDEEIRMINMEYLRNMIMEMRFQNGIDIDPDQMTY